MNIKERYQVILLREVDNLNSKKPMACSNFIPDTLPYLYICSNWKPRVCNCTYIYPLCHEPGVTEPNPNNRSAQDWPQGPRIMEPAPRTSGL